MRKQVKAALDRLGLLDIAEPVYFNLRSASPAAIWEEVRPGGGIASDGYPYPPGDLIYDVIACRWRRVYYDSGKTIVDDMKEALTSLGHPIKSFRSILDFGCGSGRLLRHIRQHTDARLFGSDYNSELVEWCRENLPFAEFSVNSPEPPLEFTDEAFDFICARSVLTHLPEASALRWMAELRRVLAPGGLLYFTMHGAPLARGLPVDQRKLFERDQMVVTYASVAGENLCSTYATRACVERNLLNGFSLAAFTEGRDVEHLRQDIYLVSKA